MTNVTSLDDAVLNTVAGGSFLSDAGSDISGWWDKVDGDAAALLEGGGTAAEGAAEGAEVGASAGPVGALLGAAVGIGISYGISHL